MNLPKNRWAGCRQMQQNMTIKEYNRELTKQFIYWLDDEGMVS